MAAVPPLTPSMKGVAPLMTAAEISDNSGTNGIQELYDAIPDPDSNSSSGSIARGGSFLDEMSPQAAVFLRVTLREMLYAA